MKLHYVLLVLVAALFLTDSIASPDPLMATRPYIPTSFYKKQKLEGWTIYVNSKLLTTRKQIGDEAIDLLASKLREIRNCVPPKALSALIKVPIWLGVDDYAIPNATYHPSADWLLSHGWNPDKAKSVEIPNAEIFLEWSKNQPMIILHELAHAYHDQVLTHQCPKIHSAYEHAIKSGRYDLVKRNDGTKVKAYAIKNEQEYFAETSEAYFGHNDFEPFTRAELQKFDPKMFSVLEHVWNR